MNKAQWTGLIACMIILSFSNVFIWSISGLKHCGKPCPVQHYPVYDYETFSKLPSYINEYNKQEGGEIYGTRKTEENKKELPDGKPDELYEQQIDLCDDSSKQNT